MEDEPSKPMDQEEEEDEFFSARETQRRQEQPPESPPPPPQRSDRESPLNAASPSKRSSKSPKSGRQQYFAFLQNFFSDENAQPLASEKSKKVRRMLKDKDRWDTREYKKEELIPTPKPKKKKKKKTTKKKSKPKERMSTEDASKTDEESDEVEEVKEPVVAADSSTPQPRPYFQSTQWLMKSKQDTPILPKNIKYMTIRFQKSREIVEYDADGEQHQLPKFNERAISNPWRRWGAHNALCAQGGYQVVAKKTVRIERGSNPPEKPKMRQQITLNKNSEIPDSQSLSGSLRVGDQNAEDEGIRIAKQVEDYVNRGGFVPANIPKKDVVVVKPKVPALPTPVVVVQEKAAPPNPLKDNSNVKVQKKKAPKTPKGTAKKGAPGGKRSSISDDSDSVTEEEKNGDGSGARGGKKVNESKKGGGAFANFFKNKIVCSRRRKPTPAPQAAKGGSREGGGRPPKNNNKKSSK
ncbi:hypothetical protein PFISCL1PPCAC_8819, partial [Pristionchus fissidentatus]